MTDRAAAPREGGSARGVAYGMGLWTGVAAIVCVFLVYLAGWVVPSFWRIFDAMGGTPGGLPRVVLHGAFGWGVPIGVALATVALNLGVRTRRKRALLALVAVLAVASAVLTLVACWQPIFETL